jgi:hypothetical protein
MRTFSARPVRNKSDFDDTLGGGVFGFGVSASVQPSNDAMQIESVKEIIVLRDFI